MTDLSTSPPDDPGSTSEPRPEGGSPDDPAVEPVGTPLLRIITPGATDEEVAALVAVVSAMAASGAEEGTRPPTPAWSAPSRRVRTLLRHGPGAWRASGLP
jgi:hypothetical protein